MNISSGNRVTRPQGVNLRNVRKLNAILKEAHVIMLLTKNLRDSVTGVDEQNRQWEWGLEKCLNPQKLWYNSLSLL